MKILFIHPDLGGGGAERVLINLLRELPTPKYETTLFLLKNKGVFLNSLPPWVKRRSGNPGKRLLFSLPGLFPSLILEARKNEILVGSIDLTATFVAQILGRICRKPVIGWNHISMSPFLESAKPLERALAKPFSKNLDHLVSVSEGTKGEFEKWVGKKIPHAKAIYNFVSPEVLGGISSKISEELEKRIFCREVIISMGRLSPQKDFQTLIRAHSHLLKRGFDCHLVILGEGPLRGKLETLTRHLGSEKHVFFLGFIDLPLGVLQKSTVFVLSSHYEGLPMVMLEAMFAGVPIIATDCPFGPREILEDGKNGVLIPAENDAILSYEIERLLLHRGERDRLVMLGRKRVSDFQPQAIIPKWETFFHETLSYASKR